MKPTKYGFVYGTAAAAAITAALATAGCAPAQPDDQRPNILFILSDDHTAQAWGIYGGPLAPYVMNDNIARLAREGCVLDNCFCTNSISVPSRAAILTGQYSNANGVYTLDDALDPAQDNIAKRMQQAGYQTALVGKWHLKKQPSGFDYFSVFHDQGEYFDPVFKEADSWVDDTEGKSGTVVEGFSTDIVADKTIGWLDNRDRSRPFAMFCQFKATHEPFHYPERFASLYDDVAEFPAPENMAEYGPEASGRVFAGQQLENMGMRWTIATQTPEKWWTDYPGLPFSTEGLDSTAARNKIYQKLVRDYLRCGAAIDDNIGRLLAYLDREGLAENTIVVYVSDQGYFLGEHGFFDKRIMYEEPLRMPFVVRYPREIPAARRSSDIVLNIDFASLLADYAGAQSPQGAQGRSFRKVLAGDDGERFREDMYYRYWTNEAIRPAHFGIRNDRYKLIFFYGKGIRELGSDAPDTGLNLWEFYDLHADPHEDSNRYGDPAYAEVIAGMKVRLLELKAEYGDTADSPELTRTMETYWQ
ncbi:sulfatase [Alistipes sp. OttesenSCG-928-B03]|nr:sulfatase [Alistipes sp. OttesenSCG-928-B03]